MLPMLRSVDRSLAQWMERYGHLLHRLSLGIFFTWLGLLKQFGIETVTSLLAHTVYWGTPDVMVPVLGWWEMLIGLCLVFRRLVRIALLLLLIRLPGTALALVLLPEVCFVNVPFVPSPEGQYLIKDMLLFSAALVIGGTLRLERKPYVYH